MAHCLLAEVREACDFEWLREEVVDPGKGLKLSVELGDWLVWRDVAEYVAGLVDRCVTRAGLRWARDGV